MRYPIIATLLLLLVNCTVYAQEDLPPPLTTCTPEQIEQAHPQTGDYVPTDNSGFVTLENGQFTVDDEPFYVRGVNYYPAQYPWRRFLTETDLPTVEQELALLRETGFNTLRIFLWHQALFQCPGSDGVPNVGVIQRLDGIIQTASNAGFRLIVTLNDLPDLEDYFLYDNPLHTQQQVTYIVSRYRDEPAILAWDLRNEGDIDYGLIASRPPIATTEIVIGWLAEVSEQVRALDDNHLITAGWYRRAEDTAPYVDFVSFHHWTGVEDLDGRIAPIRAVTDKPILLQEVGYSTQRMQLDDQARNLQTIVDWSAENDLLGWMIWTAFDFPIDRSCFPSPCQSPDNAEHYFGIWTSTYEPKPAVSVFTSPD
ncbi:MAG: cellulase family glycosylhydrolase [Chloroflexota bacterium]